MAVNPFFHNSASINVKTGTPDTEDFATTQLLFIGTSCCDGCDMQMVAQPLCELSETWKMDNRLLTGHAKNKTASVGRLRNSQWLGDHWPIVAIPAQCAKELCPICHSCGSRSQVVAKSAKSGEPVFTSMDVLLHRL
jgi:hypothetical protein